MSLNQGQSSEASLQAVVAVFETPADASRVAASLRGPDLKVQRVSRQDPTAADGVPRLVYDDIEQLQAEDVSQGILAGGALGAGSGLLLLGIPGLNVAAPVVGALVGAWIGGVAGIAEADRSRDQPGPEDYQRRLDEGHSLVVLAAPEFDRTGYAEQLQELGALEVHHHPPLGHVVRGGQGLHHA